MKFSITKSCKSIFLVFLTLYVIPLLGQEKEDFKNKIVGFTIKSHHYQSQKVADSLQWVQKELAEAYKSGKRAFPPPPSAKSPKAYDSRYEDLLLVSSEKIVLQRSPRFIESEGVTYISYRGLTTTVISRDSLTLINTHAISDAFSSKRPRPIRYFSKERFPMISENTDIVRTISGYKCHQVILKDNLSGLGFIEMYVTEEIQLEYHPFLKVKEYLNRFYPLYIKFYDPNFPKESYLEYQFEMFRISF